MRRILSLVVLIGSAASTGAFSRPPAWFAFQNGVAARQNAAEARPLFLKVAADFDGEWQSSPASRTTGIALDRGHAHFLAGNLPQAIRAFHDGLALAPYDAELQHSLAAARGTIDYPRPAAPAERVRPDPPGEWRNRVAPWDLYRVAAVCGVLVVVGLGKRLTTRPDWAVPVAVAGGLGFLVVAGCGWQMHRERLADEAKPVAVVAADGATLRTGNGDAFPPRVVEKLPRGAEVRVIGRRGGWAQVELPGGAVGWLSEASLLAAQ